MSTCYTTVDRNGDQLRFANFKLGWYGPRKTKFFAVAGPWQGSRSSGDVVENVGDFKQVDDVLEYVGDLKIVNDVVEHAGDVNVIGDAVESVGTAEDVEDIVEYAGDVKQVGDAVESVGGAKDVDVVKSLFSCNFKRFKQLVSPFSSFRISIRFC